MDGSASAIITLGLGNGTFAPSVGLLLTLGLGVGEESPVTLVGSWSDAVRIHADRATVKIHADRQRIEVRG